tara:strand:- start:5057 stop:5317 length:261 start_codon:yes stop_codon:yes gene_type:complete
MNEAFATKWGVDMLELEPREDPRRSIGFIAAAQIVCVLAVLYIIKPNFVMHRHTSGAVERFYWPSAMSIAFLIAVMTYCCPYVTRR